MITRRPTTSLRKMPDKLKELQRLFEQEAAEVQCASPGQLHLRPRDRAAAKRDRRTDRLHLFGRDARNPNRQRAEHSEQSYTITAEVDVPAGGGDGMIVTDGGRWGGYGLYLLKGKPVFTYNLLMLERFRWEGPQPLAPGKHTIVFDFNYDGPASPKAEPAC